MTSAKRLYRFALAAALVAPAILSSCSDDEPDNKYEELNLDIDKAGLSFNTDDVWAGWNKNEPLKIGDFTLSHGWAGYAFGFTAAKITDTHRIIPVQCLTISLPSCLVGDPKAQAHLMWWVIGTPIRRQPEAR